MTSFLRQWTKKWGHLSKGNRQPHRRRPRTLQLETLDRRELLAAAPWDTAAVYGPVPANVASAMTPATVGLAAVPSPASLVGDALTRPTAKATPSRSVAASAASKAPYGATAGDTSEYMIGDVAVSVVLLESNGRKDRQTENWTKTEIEAVKRKISEGFQWWEDTFQNAHAVTPRDHLDFQIDFTYADRPVATKYEPINRRSTDQGLWIDDFLTAVKYQTKASYFDDLDRWNDALRQRKKTDWSFTVFVVDSTTDADGKFAEVANTFAYAYLGGPFLVMTYDNFDWGIDKMGQVLAHEVGHIFYALDEYPDSPQTYYDRSGYYDTQNVNAANQHPNPASRGNSIMAESRLQNPAYDNHTSSPSSLEMIGWKDTDRDGIDDVLDVPLMLNGSGAYNAAAGVFEFTGSSAAGVLQNLNPQNSNGQDGISINTVDVLQYRLDSGAWQDGSTYGAGSASVRQSVPVGAGQHTIEFRTLSRENGVTSPVWSQSFDAGAGPSVIISQTGGSTQVAEGGATDTYTAVLGTRPTENVVITVAPGGQVRVSPSKLTFTKTNWNKPQTVTVTAVNDTIPEGLHNALISHTVSSSDAKYKTVKARAVDVRITDDDTPNADNLMFVNRGGSGGHVMIADVHTGRIEAQYWENYGDNPLLGGWQDPDDLQLTGDFMGLGHDQVMYINNGGSSGRVMVLDYQNGAPVVRFWESWTPGQLLDGWHEAGDLRYVGDFLNLGHDQVLFINNGGSGGRVLIADFQTGRTVGRYWESWGANTLLDGFHDANDRQFAGDFMDLGYDQLCLINNSRSGGHVMIVDYRAGKPNVQFREDWAPGQLLDGWHDPGDNQHVGDFKGLGYDQVLFINNGGSGGRVLIADFRSGRTVGRFWESWGDSPLLGGWHDATDLLFTGDFMGLGYDQVMFINNSGADGRVLVLDYRAAQPIVRFWENYATSRLLDGWHEAEDLVFSGRFI